MTCCQRRGWVLPLRQRRVDISIRRSRRSSGGRHWPGPTNGSLLRLASPEFGEAGEGGQCVGDRLSLFGRQLGDERCQVAGPVVVAGPADLPACLGDVNEDGASVARVGWRSTSPSSSSRVTS